MNSKMMQEILQAALQPATVVVESADDVHFDVKVISALFSAKSRVERQKMVYAALREPLADGSVHALSLKTWTPEEWQDSQDK